jgi:hypothetical protein
MLQHRVKQWGYRLMGLQKRLKYRHGCWHCWWLIKGQDPQGQQQQLRQLGVAEESSRCCSSPSLLLS